VKNKISYKKRTEYPIFDLWSKGLSESKESYPRGTRGFGSTSYWQ